MLLAICVLSFVALVAAMYELGRQVFGAVVGVVAALLLLSRLDFPFLAARGYIDIPYMALVFWAAALEVARPRRGGWVWVLLTLAGLLRPEAWVLAGLYALRIVWGRPLAVWVRTGLIVAVAPVVWAISDWIVTGDPLYSLNYTTESAALLGRRQTLDELPGVTLRFLAELVKPPVLRSPWRARARVADGARARAPARARDAAGLGARDVCARLAARLLGHQPLPRRGGRRAAALRGVRGGGLRRRLPAGSPRAAAVGVGGGGAACSSGSSTPP